MNFRVKSIVMILFVLSSIISNAQDTTKCRIDMDLTADLMSRYVWRGSQYGGNLPSLQPSFKLNIKNLEAGIWGAYSITGRNYSQEFDVYLSYTFADEMFSAMITDYYFPEENSTYEYFNYRENSTGHILEGTISFNGTEKFPLTFLAALNFYGADATTINNNTESNDFNTEDGIQYSSYFEIGYETKIKNVDFNAFMGGTINSPREENHLTGYIGETGFYGEKPGIVNIGIKGAKEIKITDQFSLPISSSIVVNPMTENVYFIFGITL